MPTFGVVVLSLRGNKNLAACLRSVAWADEILLLYAGGAPEIGGGEFPSLRVRALESPADAGKYFGAIKTDWVLQLWAEERLDPELQREVRELCRGESRDGPKSYRIGVRSRILGEWVEGSIAGPSPAARLRRNPGAAPFWWSEEKSTAAIARGWIEDHGSAELGRGVARVQDLSDFWADHLRGMSAPPGALAAAACSGKIFIRMLARSRVFTRGLPAAALSALAAYAILLSGAKLWEAKHAGGNRRM